MSTNIPKTPLQPDFGNLFQTMTLGVVYHNSNGKIITANPAAERILGLSFDQMIGRTSLDPRWHSIHEDGTDFSGDTHPVMIALNTGKPVDNIIMGIFNTVENNYRWILINAVPEFRENEDHPFQVYSTFNDITELKKANFELLASRELVRKKIESITFQNDGLSNLGFSDLELSDLLNKDEIQKLMDEFHAITNLPMSIIDMKGKVLVGVGWQKICVDFHRKNPETCRNCIESDTILTQGITPGSSKLYRCKNNLWDIATPFMLKEQQVGNIFMGQFIFENETLDIEYFRNQAKEYGFDEKIYLSALSEVPVISRKVIDSAMSFFSDFSKILSNLGYNQIWLSKIISEKDQLLKEILMSEEKLKLLVQNSNDLISIINSDGTSRFSSPAITKILGYTPQEFQGVNIFRLVHPDDLEEMNVVFQNLLNKVGHAVKTVTRMLHKDGNYRFIESFAQSLINDGIIDGIVVNSRDITETKRAEEHLKKSELHYRNFFEKDITGNYLSTPEGRLIDCNHSFVKLLGYESKEEILSTWMTDIYPSEESRNDFIQALSKDKVLYNSTCNLVRKDGKPIICVENVIGIFDESGNLVQFQGYMIDITEQKKAQELLINNERNFRTLFNSIKDFLFILDYSGNIKLVNQTVTDRLGYSMEELINKSIETVHPKNKHAEVKIIVEEMLEGKRTFCPIPLITKNGELIPVETSISPGFWNGEKTLFGVSKDISDLKLSELKFSTAFHASPVIMGLSSIETGDYLEVNQTFCDTLGFTSDEVIGKKPTDILKLDSHVRKTLIHKLMEEGKLRNEETILYKKNGEKLHVLLSAEIIELNNIKVNFTSAMDITDRKNAELALIKSEERFRLMVKNSSDIIVVINPDGTQRYVSPAVERITGYSTEYVTRLNIAEIIHPEDFPTVMSVWNKAVLSPDKLHSVQYRHIHKTKKWVYLEAVGQSFLHEQHINAIIVSVRDISDRKKEEMIQNIQYNIAQAIVTSKTRNELYLTVKNELNQLIDTSNIFIVFASDSSNVLNTELFKNDFQHKEQWLLDNCLSGIVITEGKSLFLQRDEILAMEYSKGCRFIDRTDEYWIGVPLFIKGQSIGVLGIQINDPDFKIEKYSREVLEIVANQISLYLEKLKDEEELIVAKEKAEGSDRLKTEFLNNMSHEIRTPLNGILGFTNFMNEPDATAEDRDYYFRIVNRNVNQLISIIDDIISIATIEAHQETINEKNCNIHQLIKDLSDQFKKNISSKVLMNYKIRLVEKECFILVDETKLHQIISNLLGNAIKFTEQGVIQIICELVGNSLQFTISDTGLGIRPEYLEMIFERFRQVRSDNKKLYGGTGLGLAISKAYVELMGGKIWVDSTPGKGSSFYFTIPYKPIEMVEIKETRRPIETQTIKPGHGKSILLAEDDWTNYMLADRILTLAGFKVIRVSTGLEAIDEFRKNTDIDLILMDLKMPVMSGFEATKVIKTERPLIPIIAITAYAQEKDREKALEAGCDDYIVKPITKKILLDQIFRHLQIK